MRSLVQKIMRENGAEPPHLDSLSQITFNTDIEHILPPLKKEITQLDDLYIVKTTAELHWLDYERDPQFTSIPLVLFVNVNSNQKEK